MYIGSTLNKNEVANSLLLFSSLLFFYYSILKPVYLISILIIFLYFMVGKAKFNFLYIFIFFSYLILSYYQIVYLNADIGILFLIILTWLLLPCYVYIVKQSNKSTIKKFLLFSFVLFALEAFYRISNPIYFREGVEVLSDGLGWFYPYKMNSFMFMDSNFVAINIFSLFFISLFFDFKKYSLIFFILILLTFSRSAILFSIVSFCMFVLYRSNYKPLVIPILLLLFFCFLYYSVDKLEVLNDGSFLTKFYIIETVLFYVSENFSFGDYLFGVGLGNSYNIIGIGAHNIFVVLFFEFGILGGFLYLLSLVFLCTKYVVGKYRIEAMIFILSLLLMGLSLGVMYFPIFALILCLLKKGNWD